MKVGDKVIQTGICDRMVTISRETKNYYFIRINEYYEEKYDKKTLSKVPRERWQNSRLIELTPEKEREITKQKQINYITNTINANLLNELTDEQFTMIFNLIKDNKKVVVK